MSPICANEADLLLSSTSPYESSSCDVRDPFETLEASESSTYSQQDQSLLWAKSFPLRRADCQRVLGESAHSALQRNGAYGCIDMRVSYRFAGYGHAERRRIG